MQTVFGLEGAPAPLARDGAYAAIGVFDGVHVGHQSLLRLVVAWAREQGGQAVVVTFQRHPRLALEGTRPPCITSLRHRLRLFEGLGVDVALVLNFDDRLAAMSAERFLRHVLRGRVGARGLALGHDQRFGRGGLGDAALARRVGAELGLEVRVAPVVRVAGEVVSSTAVRSAIRAGWLDRAAAMLGRPVSALGTVVHGQAKGRTLSCPTANLDLHHELQLPEGVYVGAALAAGREHGAVVNIGRRPTFAPQGQAYLDAEPLVEAHLLDFSGDLYGQELEVRFLKRLREERVFASAEALQEQMARDVEEARRALAQRNG